MLAPYRFSAALLLSAMALSLAAENVLAQSETADIWAEFDYATTPIEQADPAPIIRSARTASFPQAVEEHEILPPPQASDEECCEKQESFDIQKDLSAFDELIDDKSIVRSGTDASINVFGRVHIDAWGFPSNDPSIDTLEGGPDGPQARLGFRRVRIGVEGDLPSNMLYRIDLELSGGNFSEFRDVWFGWKDLPIVHTLQFGNQKRPYGLDHWNSSLFNVFMERPFVIESFNQDARRWGLQSLGLSQNQRWNWQYGVFNQRLIQDEGTYVGDHLQMEFAGRLANTMWYDEVSGGRGYQHLAVAASYARPDGTVAEDSDPTGPDVNEARFATRPEARSATQWLDTGRIAGTQDYGLLALESVTNLGPLQITGEWQHIWLNRDENSGADLKFWGAYIYASYFLTGEHMPWDRRTGELDRPEPFENFFLVHRCRGGVGGGWGAWQIAARYSYADFNDDDIMGGMGESLTLGLNWYWTANARLQLNWLHGRIKENGVTRAPDVLSGNYDIIGLRGMVDF